jgi:non-ribosomal peptide synthetase component E (peptide arylation enzyme)
MKVSPDDRMDARQDIGPGSIDDLFRRAAARTPDAWALVDPPDRAYFTDAAPRRLTYAGTDRAIEALAGRLLDLGLAPGSIVALQMPNVVENVIALLGVLRAGMIAAPMPLLWRQADAVSALGQLAPRALIVLGRVGAVDHGEIVIHVAAEIFAVRFVCGFGSELPDGVIALDDVFDATTRAPAPSRPKAIPPQDVAVVTFDVTAQGIVPVAHSHAELMAAGNAIVAEAALTPGGAILGALATSSFAGLGSLVMPWLITGGRLALHQPFSPQAFLAQLNDEHCETAVVPAAILAPMQEAGLVGRASALRAVLAVWRSPEFLSTAAAWPNAAPACVDVAAFGEAGIVAQRRGSDGRPAGIPLGAPGSEAAIEVAPTATGTLALRGPMVPARPAAGIAPGDPRSLRIDAEGFVDTEYPCRLDPERNTLIVSGPPAGLVNVGGYRFAWHELQDLLTELGEGGSLAALPDRLAGHRLAGVAADPERVRNALAARGVNPLVVAAFRDRR